MSDDRLKALEHRVTRLEDALMRLSRIWPGTPQSSLEMIQRELQSLESAIRRERGHGNTPRAQD